MPLQLLPLLLLLLLRPCCCCCNLVAFNATIVALFRRQFLRITRVCGCKWKRGKLIRLSVVLTINKTVMDRGGAMDGLCLNVTTFALIIRNLRVICILSMSADNQLTDPLFSLTSLLSQAPPLFIGPSPLRMSLPSPYLPPLLICLPSFVAPPLHSTPYAVLVQLLCYHSTSINISIALGTMPRSSASGKNHSMHSLANLSSSKCTVCQIATSPSLHLPPPLCANLGSKHALSRTTQVNRTNLRFHWDFYRPSAQLTTACIFSSDSANFLEMLQTWKWSRACISPTKPNLIYPASLMEFFFIMNLKRTGSAAFSARTRKSHRK